MMRSLLPLFREGVAMPTALITGASSGIGAAFAAHFADAGYRLVLVARHEDRLAAAVPTLLGRGAPAVEVIAADLTVAEQRTPVVERLGNAADPISMVVNNAGMGLGKSFRRSTPEELQYQLDLNVTALQALTKAALPGMIERGHGGVINIASIAGVLPSRGSVYGASKAWVIAFSESVAMSLRGTGVRMVAVCPGFVRTEFHQRASIDMSGTPGWMYVDMDVLVRESIAGLRRNQLIVTPGLLYKAIGAAARLAPRPLVRWAADRVEGRRRA